MHRNMGDGRGPRYTPSPEAVERNERVNKNMREAMKLLDIINAEFTSDPMSVQCFDLRIVERVKYCIALEMHEGTTLNPKNPGIFGF